MLLSPATVSTRWALRICLLALACQQTQATCASGVWDEYSPDLSDATTEIPFEPQLVTTGAGASGLSFTGVTDESLLILKVRVSSWFQEADVTLSTYDFCSDSYTTTYDNTHAEMVEGCDSDYKVYKLTIPYVSDCNFTVDEDPGLTTLSGYLSVAATVDQDFLGQTIERSFEVPVGWYISYDTDFSVTTTTSISQSNECYDGQEADHCSSFPCDASPTEPNVCNCATAYDDPQATVAALPGAEAVLHGLCSVQSHSHNAPARECSVDTADPVIWCTADSTEPGAYVIDLNDQSALLSLATLTGAYGDGDFATPYFDDCQVPGAGGLTDLASVDRTISFAGGVSLDNTSLAGSYVDTSIGSFVFNQVGLWQVQYSLADDSANTGSCSFYVSVVDTAGPTVCSVEGNTYNLRGYRMEEYDALSRQSAEYTPGESDTGVDWGASVAAHWISNGYQELNWRTQLQTVFQTVCIDEAAAHDAQGNTHCSGLTLDAALSMDPSGVTDWADSSAVSASAFYDQLATVYTPKCHSDLYSATKSGGAGNVASNCLHEGTFTMAFTVEDESGNTRACSVDLVIANTPPELDCAGAPKYINQFQAPRYGLTNGTYKGETGQAIVGFDAFGHEFFLDVTTGYRTDDLAGSASVNYTVEAGSVAVDSQLLMAVLQDEAGGAPTTIATSAAELLAYSSSLALPHPDTDALASSWSSPLFVYWAAFDAVGNTRVCTVAYTPKDVTPPTTSCKATRALELPATSSARLVRLGDLLDIAPVSDDVHSEAEFFAISAGPTAPYTFDVYQSLSYCVITCPTPPCTAAGQDPDEAFGGVTARRLRRRVATADSPGLGSSGGQWRITGGQARRSLTQYDGADAVATGVAGKYDETCVDALWFDTSLNTTTGGTFVFDADWPADFGLGVGEGPGDLADPMTYSDGLFFAYRGDMTVEIQIDDLLDDVATDAESDTGTAYYFTYGPAPAQVQTCSNTLSVIDVDDPVIGVCPDGADVVHTLGQHDFAGPSGTFEAAYYLDAMVDETNYKLILAGLTDNSQLGLAGTDEVLGIARSNLYSVWSQPHWEFVFLDPSYTTADSAAGIQTGTAYARNAEGATQPLVYTAYDSSGNSATCTLQLDVIDDQQPDPDCPFAQSSTQTYAMDSGVATAAVTHVFTVHEGQSTDPSTEWTLTSSVGTLACVPGAGDDEFTCTQAYTLSAPEGVVEVLATIDDENTRAVASECRFNMVLVDTEDPVVTLCTANLDLAYGLGAIDAAWLSGGITALHTATDNWGLHETTPWTYVPDITDGAYQWFLGADPDDNFTNTNQGQGVLTITATVSDRATATSGGPNTATCQFTITPVTSCGDGFMDLQGAWGTAEECEQSPHPESPGCTASCVCDTANGWVADPEGGCVLECADGEPAGEDCAFATAYLPGDCTGATLEPAVGVGSTGTAAWLKPLEPDCTPGDPSTWGTACNAYYTVNTGLGYPHYQGNTLTNGAGYYAWDDSANALMAMDISALQAFLVNPYEAVAFEWWLAGGINTPADAADADDVHVLEICDCAFFEGATVAAHVLDSNGDMTVSDQQCADAGLLDGSGDPFLTTYHAGTQCFRFPLCRTGPVVIGRPVGQNQALATCLDQSAITVTNEATQDNYASVNWGFSSRVQLFPGVLEADVVMSTAGSVPALGEPVNLNTDGGDFFADPDEGVFTVTATMSYNGSIDTCSWPVLVQDVVEPTVDCTGYAITLTGIDGGDFTCADTTCTLTSGNVERAAVTVSSLPASADETEVHSSADCNGPLFTFTPSYDFANSAETWDPTLSTGLCGVPDCSGDGCLGPYDHEDGILSIWGNVTVEVTAVDEAGNVADTTCSVVYRFVDATPPVVVCPASQAVPYSTDAADFTGTVDIDYTVTDNSGLTLGQVVLGSGFVHSDTWTTGSYTAQTADDDVTITHQDAFGNEGSCVTTLTWFDGQGPDIACPSSPSITLNEADVDCAYSSGICIDFGKTTTTYFTVSDAVDALADVAVSVEVDFGNGSTSVLTNPVVHLANTWLPTWSVSVTAIDSSGNSEASPCTFDIVWADTRDPELTCPSGGATVDLLLSAVDAGGDESTLYVSAPTTQTFLALEDPGTACLPGTGTTPTTIWCPAYLDTYGGGTTNGDDIVATPAGPLTVGTTVEVTYTVDDSKGNTATAVCNVSVTDDVAPIYDTECGTHDAGTRQIDTSALLVPATTGDPDSSLWDWANTDLDHVFTSLGWQIPTAGWYESTGTSPPWFTQSGDTDMTAVDLAPLITVPQASVSFSVTGTDSAANAATCAYAVSLVDNVPPEVTVCNSATEVTYNMSDCCGTDTCTSCAVTLSVDVAEDIRLVDVCTNYDVNGASCNLGVLDIDGPVLQTLTESNTVDYSATPTVLGWAQTSLADWTGNTVVEHATCGITVTTLDDQLPVPAHSCLDSTPAEAAARDTRARIHNGGDSLIVPLAIWPRPDALDADTVVATITVSVDGAPATTMYNETIAAGGTLPALDAGLNDERVRGEGVYEVVYSYADASGNTEECHYKLTVLPAYSPGTSDPLLVSFYISDGQNQTARRRAVQQVGEDAEFHHFTGTLTWLIAQGYPVETALTATNSPATTFSTDSPVQLTSEGINCLSTPANTKVAAPPELIDSLDEGDKRCYEVFSMTFDLSNCSALLGTIAADHTGECKPAGDANDLGWLFYNDANIPNTRDATFTPSATPKCLDTWNIELVEMQLRAFNLCKMNVGGVSLSERFLLGTRAWATGIVQGVEVAANGQFDPDDITPFADGFAVQGETGAETIEICAILGVLPAVSGAVQSSNGAEIESVSLSALTVSAYSDAGQTTLVSGPTDVLPTGSLIAGTSARATLSAACWTQAVPDRAEDSADGLLSLRVVADGAAIYRLNAAGSGRRRAVQSWEQDALDKTHTAKLQLSAPLVHEDPGRDSALVRMLRREVVQERRTLAQSGETFAAPVQESVLATFPIVYKIELTPGTPGESTAAPGAGADHTENNMELAKMIITGGLILGGVAIFALSGCAGVWAYTKLRRKHSPVPQTDDSRVVQLAEQDQMHGEAESTSRLDDSLTGVPLATVEADEF